MGLFGQRHSAALLCLAVCVVGLAARLHNIGIMPFWLDEVTTVHRSSLPFRDLVHDALAAHHLPSYFLIASWIGQFGATQTVLRLPSAVFGGVAAGVVFLIGARIGGWRAGLVAGLLMALSPLQVQYGQEARAYTFVIVMMAVGLLGLVELARHPHEAVLPWRDPAMRWAPWALYVVGTLGALQVLSTAFFWLISANCAVLAILRDTSLDRRQFLTRWLVAQALVLAPALPWFAAMAVVTGGKMTNATDWVPPITAHSFLSTLGSLYLMRISRLISFHLFPVVVPGFGALLLLLCVLGLIWLWSRPAAQNGGAAREQNAGPQRTLFWTVGIAAAAPPLTILLISLFKPLWMPRYLMWSSVPFFVLVGLGIDLLPRRRWQSLATATMILLAAINLGPYYRVETKPRWDLAAFDLAAAMQPRDILLVPDRGPIDIMNFFLQGQGQVIPSTAWTKDVFAAALRLQEGGRVWVVAGKVGQADHTTRQAFQAITRPLGVPVRSFHEGDLILVQLYDRAPAGNLIAAGSDTDAP